MVVGKSGSKFMDPKNLNFNIVLIQKHHMDLRNPVANFKTQFNYIKNLKSNQNKIFSRLDLPC
jgi:hypothetical protein